MPRYGPVSLEMVPEQYASLPTETHARAHRLGSSPGSDHLALRASESRGWVHSTRRSPERLPAGAGDVGQSNSPARTPAVNAVHSAAVNVRVGPAGFLLFRTARAPLSRSATSTQLAWALLRLLLRQVAL